MNVIPLILQVLVCLLIQIGSLIYLYNQEWFVPLPPGKEEIIESWENTVLFLVSSYQYIILATVYSKGKPYRERLITNFWFIVTALGLICFLTWLVVCPPEKLADIFDVIYLTHHDSYEQLSFRYCLLLFPITHFFVSVFIEVSHSQNHTFSLFIKIFFFRLIYLRVFGWNGWSRSFPERNILKISINVFCSKQTLWKGLTYNVVAVLHCNYCILSAFM